MNKFTGKTFYIKNRDLFEAIAFVMGLTINKTTDTILAYSKDYPQFKYIEELPIEEKLMTREEAEKKIHGNAYHIKSFLDALEALGLIKFKKEKNENTYSTKLMTVVKECRMMYEGTEEFLKALEEKGYTVRDNG